MSKIDTNWFNTDSGSQIVQAIKYNGKLKKLGPKVYYTYFNIFYSFSLNK